MSPSAFHLHFKGVTALSPVQYQKRLRPQEAPPLMLDEGPDAAEATFRVGYESPSQVKRAYPRWSAPRRARTWPRSGSKFSRQVSLVFNVA
jgi:AraC-like DNA-binding protein